MNEEVWKLSPIAGGVSLQLSDQTIWLYVNDAWSESGAEAGLNPKDARDLALMLEAYADLVDGGE